MSLKEEEHLKVIKNILNRESLEDKALASLTSETLQKLNISTEKLPRKCRMLLEQVAQLQTVLDLQALEPITLTLHKSKELTDKLDDEYQLLELKQKNKELQTRIDRNDKFISKLRKDLEYSRRSLSSQDPNPDSIEEHLRQMRQKLRAYEDSYESLNKKYSARNIPESILPQSLNMQLSSLHTLNEEAMILKQQVDEVILMKETKAALYRFRK